MSPRGRTAYAAPAWAAEQKVGDVGTKAVLLVLANYADEDFSCFPGQETIADETEQSVRTVRRQLELLRELGLIRREPRYDKRGKRTSDRYYLQLDEATDLADVEAAKERLAQGRTVSEKVATELPANVSGSAKRVDADTTSGQDVSGSERDYRPNPTVTTGQIEQVLPDTGGRVTPRRTPSENSQEKTGGSASGVPPRQGALLDAPTTDEQKSTDDTGKTPAQVAEEVCVKFFEWVEEQQGFEVPADRKKRAHLAIRKSLVLPALESGATRDQVATALGNCKDEWPSAKRFFQELVKVRGGRPLSAQPERKRAYRNEQWERDQAAAEPPKTTEELRAEFGLTVDPTAGQAQAAAGE